MAQIMFIPQSVQGQTAANASRRDTRAGLDICEGSTFTAELTEINNGVATLRTKDDLAFNTSATSINGEIGDTLTFQVVKNDKSGLSLKQIIQKDAEQPARPARQQAGSPFEIKEFTKIIRDISDEEKTRTETQQENQAKMARAIAKIQRAQSYLSDAATPSALSVLLETGLSMNKISFSVLNRVMHEASKEPNPSPDLPPVAQSLRRNGLPVNNKNTAALEQAWESLPANADDRTIERLIADESELTQTNLYVSRFSSPDAARTDKADLTAEWDNLAGEVQKRFKRDGIEDKKVNRDAARFLIERDLPLDKGNIEKIVFLRNIKLMLSKEAFFDKAAECMANDTPIADIPLDNLASAPVQNDSQALASRRILAETQLKYTAEAAARLRNSDITINTAPVRETLDKLSRYLRMAGTDDGEAPVSQMAELYDTLADIRPLTVNVHANILSDRANFTIGGIHESVLTARAQAGYDMFATVPNPRYGDSFTKVRAQFGALLDGLGIEATADHVKASYILSKNNIDVTLDSINAVKEIDAKINAVIDNLHPMIAAHMIKDGLSPMDMQADEVLAYIKQFNKTYGEDGGEKIAQYIKEMDDNKSIDADTRKSMIAVYRMLHVIQKNGAAALGLAAKQDTPLTLGSLMELAKYYEKQKMTGTVYDRQVDDTFGYLESLEQPEVSIRAILENATRTRPPLTYTDIITDTFIERAEPKALRAMLEDIPNGTERALEDINAEVIPEPVLNPVVDSSILQHFVTMSPELVTYLQHRGIPATPAAVRAMERLNRNPRAYAEMLNELEDKTGDLPEDLLPDTKLRPLREGRVPAQIYAQLLAGLETTSVTVTAAHETAALRTRLNSENGFDLPIRVNGRVAGLSLYVLNERALLDDGARVLMSLDTQSLGTVQGYFTLNDGTANVLITAGTPEAVNILESESGTLSAMLEEVGITLGKLRFDVESAAPRPAETPQKNAPHSAPMSEHEYIV